LSDDDDLGVLFARLAAVAPHAAVLDAPGRAPLNRSDCAALAHARAAEAAHWGLARGDVLAWAVADRPATAAATIVLPATATLAPLPADAPGASAGPLLARLRPKALAVDAGASAAWRIAAERLGIAIVEVAPVPGAPAGAFDWTLAQAAVSLDRAPTLAPSVAYVCTTSGTTGRPKLVPLSHRQVAWPSVRPIAPRC
jgi:acyl-coenzyme A synthetase/AMP-(fatty) acid ligase